MPGADGKLFEVLSDDVCRSLLRSLLRHDEPQTQRQLTSELRYNSSTVSRRMKELEDLGIVARTHPGTPRAPYEILFPSKTRALLLTAVQLANLTRTRQAEEAAADERQLLKEGMDGGHVRDQAKEA
jgi:DNA-binding Lrp family transcriptional regulator